MIRSHQLSNVMIGIDVSKNKLDVIILPGKKHLIIENKEKAIRKFIKELKKSYAVNLITMESTGGYEKLSGRLFHEAGLSVHIAHPNRVYHFAKAKGYFGKTDKQDAEILAYYGNQEEIVASKIASKEQENLKMLNTRRMQLIDLLTSEKLRLSHPKLFADTKKSIKRIINHLKREIALIDEKLHQAIKCSKEKWEKFKQLTSCNGIGKVIATALICQQFSMNGIITL